MHAFLTPPEAAKELGVKPHKILAFIRSGDLKAADFSERPGVGHPRFKIKRADWNAFIESRTYTPKVKPTRRARRSTARKYF